MRRAFFFIVAIAFATTSFASIPRASALDPAPSIATPSSETRIRVSDVLAPFERPAPSLLSQALRQGYEQTGTTNASGLGRFLSVDPVLDLEKTLHMPPLWNRYSYVGNNPLGYVDPGGKLRVRANNTGYVGSNRPYVYSITFENRIGMVGRGGSAVAKRFLGPLKQLPGIIDKGADLLVGKEAKTEAKNLKGVDAIAGFWDTAKFEGKIQDAFKELGAQSLAGSGYFDDKGLQTLQKAVDTVLSQMVEAGEITQKEADQVRREYDVERLRDEAERMSVDTNPTDDRRQ